MSAVSQPGRLKTPLRACAWKEIGSRSAARGMAKRSL
jgi:hypothetical protein